MSPTFYIGLHHKVTNMTIYDRLLRVSVLRLKYKSIIRSFFCELFKIATHIYDFYQTYSKWTYSSFIKKIAPSLEDATCLEDAIQVWIY